MAVQRYKICPVCGELNPPSLLECRNCETDLTGVKMTDPSEEVHAEKAGVNCVEAGTDKSAFVRVCDCGARNLPQARKCIACGEDISDIMPVPSTKDAGAFRLEAVGDSFSVTITEPECIIGRTEKLKEYLEDKMYVSRRHARLTVAGDQVFIENLSSTNRTFINNQPVIGSEPQALQEGDEIGLGGIETGSGRQEQAAYFYFRRQGGVGHLNQI